MSDGDAWVVAYDDADVSLETVGGKGLNLARLSAAGFAVPAGFLLTTAAYRVFVAENQLQPLVLATANGAAPDDPVALDEAEQAIRARFAQGRVPPELEKRLVAAWNAIAAAPVAVRSSATAEDLPGLSFAGQHETRLNVVTAEALLEAVVHCWSSLWTGRAIAYRARNGIAHDDVALAVAVQQMADAECSGVLFTANPQNGRRAELVIEATLGLGEALVSGQVEPDRYVVAADGAVLERTLGSKAHSLRPRADGGTLVVSELAGDRPALAEDALRELAELGRRIAAFYEAPQDVEWAFDGEHFAVLQSRPITSLFPLPEGMAAEPLRVMLSFGAVQGMLDPLTPLGRDTLMTMAARGPALFGAAFTRDTQPIVRVAAERLFVDISPVAHHALGRRVLRVALPLLEPGGAQGMQPLWDDPRLGRRLPRSGAIRLRSVLRVAMTVLGRLLATLHRPDRGREQLGRAVERLVADVSARVAAATTLRERVALIDMLADSVFPFLIPSFAPRLAAGFASLNVLRLACRATPGAPDVLELMRGLPHNVTTEMDLELWACACAIRDDPDSAACFRASDAGALARRYLDGELPPAAQARVRAFMERYGMRGVAEIDLGRPRWREDPTALMQVMQSYLEIDGGEQAPDAAFARGAAEAEAAIEALAQAARATRGGWLKSRVVRAAARRMRALAGLRESPKFTAIRMFGMVRAALLESGRAPCDAGLLERPEDLFYLHRAEIEALDAGAQRDWRAVVAGRRASWRREGQRRQVPRILLSDGQALYTGLTPAAAGDGDLAGSPVSPGVVEGVVRVLEDPRGARLAPGEILVCPATDPGWTPLFLAAGGLIMEVGGLMTHGAVVAREYGIPAVVGVDDATRRLASGQRVRLDGSSGRIDLLPDERTPD